MARRRLLKQKPIVRITEDVALTQEQMNMVESMAAIGLNTPQIASIIGVSASSLLRRMHDTPEVGQAIERGRAKGIAKISETAYKMADSGDMPTMTQFFLKCKAGWADKQHVEMTGKDGSAIKVKHQVTDADLDAEIRDLIEMAKEITT